MRAIGLGILAFSLLGNVLAAQEVQFPYEAVIQGEEVYVRSGPSRKYYPTIKLNAGDRVTVHRHDPGGWYMIAPPPGSFSWIPAGYVQKTDGNRGTVTENNVVVRVGSFQSDIRDVVQRKLSQGDEVQILAEKVLTSEKGPETWYQIVPPTAEYRWILGQYAVPVDQLPPGGLTVATETGERLTAAGEETAVPAETPDPFAQPARPAGDPPGTVRTGPNAEELAEYRQQLESLDAEFRAILDQRPEQWAFDQLEQDYAALGGDAPSVALQGQIQLRLATIQEYREIRADYLEFIRLSAVSSQRDGEVLSVNSGVQAPSPRPGGTAPVPANMASQAVTSQPQTTTVTRAAPAAEGTQPSAQPQSPQPAAQSPVPQRRVQFDGAGIIQRLAPTPGLPAFALVAPNGRMLAYLIAPNGLDLGRFVGQSMGINGSRSFDPRLRADVLQIQQLTPVRLAP